MAPGVRPLHVPKSFDDAKLASMVAPLTVRIEKFRGNARIPIPIPENEEGKPGGTDWTLEDVRQVESWLVNEWAGGGTYEITVTDSSTPSPLTMKWNPHWPPAEYPERTPPTLAAGAMPRPPQNQPQQPQVIRMPAFPNGLPAGGGYPAAPMSPYQPQQVFYSQPQMPAAPPVGSQQWGAYAAEIDRRQLDAELRQLRDAKAQSEREALAIKHAADLRAVEQANERRFESRFQQQDSKFDQLLATVTSLATAIKDGSNNSRPNAEIEALKEQTRRLEIERENERREREAERRAVEAREEMRRVQENTTRQIEQMQRQFEASQAQSAAIAAASANNKHDPIIAMMQEQTRVQAEALKELARNQTLQMERYQGFMMNPRDMIAMAKESRDSVDSATEKVANQFGRIFEMQQKATEHILNMQPQGGGALDLVRDGMQGVKDIAERYMSGKATAERMQKEAQVQIAQAQSSAYVASVQAQQQPAQPVPATAAPVVAATQLAGATVTPISSAKKSKKAKKADLAPASDPKAKRLGRTDHEWFGSALMPEVDVLRRGVAHFIESCDMQPTRMDSATNMPEGVTPDMAAVGIMQAVGAVQQAKLALPAMIDLFFQERFADFVDVLIPDAPQNYRDDLTQIVIGHVNRAKSMAGEPPVAEHDDDDDDDDDDDAELDDTTDDSDGADGTNSAS